MNHSWNPVRPIVALVVGVNAAGKSAFSREFASAMERSAYVEVDELRYKVMGGLVAHRRGINPSVAPKEYALQCDLACRNAVALAGVFTAAGFSVVIDGISEAYTQRREWLHREIPGCEVVTVGVYCTADVLESRRAERGWPSTLPLDTAKKLLWYSRNEGHMDYVVDTGKAQGKGFLDVFRDICSTR
jgi:chloramphenicol 3-O-phosphotransferase